MQVQQVGARCNCERCGKDCQVGPARNPDAKMLRRSAVPKGYCLECAVSEWLANTYPVNMIIEESQHGPAMLLHPGIREQFGAIMEAAFADARLDEIDWQKVVDNWSLPMKVKTGMTNPHTPGDSMRRRLGHRQYQAETRAAVRSLFGQPEKDPLGYLPDEEDDGGYVC